MNDNRQMMIWDVIAAQTANAMEIASRANDVFGCTDITKAKPLLVVLAAIPVEVQNDVIWPYIMEAAINAFGIVDPETTPDGNGTPAYMMDTVYAVLAAGAQTTFDAVLQNMQAQRREQAFAQQAIATGQGNALRRSALIL
jgi:hypothetical protein